MPKGNPAVPTCGHPDRRVKGHGKCEKCYDVEYYRRPDKAEAARARTRKWREENPERVRENEYRSHVKRKFGVVGERYVATLLAQGGGCAICGNPPAEGKRLFVDHCHATGKVRALLCLACNSGLGQFKDSPELLETAARYVRHHAGRDADAA